ncbi:hypothetical protein GUITHDRAFT_153608 [Guillardia theta CCMP2712]|uniref:BZIP domain-containing protein n=1 Tax=Guillardia theta (strain CCMP2712) TaxID=905079 RepID=L1J1K7_GUITC|nr:hypothetical protein GUITHDRAFT_153608 [Guillardia theta CCMP2712]EKX42408.1 hypothetical protein GUITHDRAFT_153608 [Guillardia theta CCMP2712]|mmetsp:Transcript_35599/g.111368  ORF Transcript_35599/g.111368 Transcript_35599/m.111368 type:complete len:239 (-) Transcript_35599:263-979(-)|eukprot:XP_005829388.1 hypothetical protein GUITHDRAFT_153608 [Guillardia theta CCMP2712]
MKRPHDPSVNIEQELQDLSELQQQHADEEEVPAELKQRVRVLKNRLSAKKSREQAREYVKNLEAKLAVVSTESQILAHRLATLEAENAQLRASRTFHDCPSMEAGRFHMPFPASLSFEVGGEKKRTINEPAVLSQTSLQLDALLLLLSTAWASLLHGSSPSQRPLVLMAAWALSCIRCWASIPAMTAPPSGSRQSLLKLVAQAWRCLPGRRSTKGTRWRGMQRRRQLLFRLRMLLSKI